MEKRLWTLYKDVRSTSWKGAGSSIIVLTSISLESSSSRSSSRACMNMYALNPSNLLYSVQLCLHVCVHVCVHLESLFMATPKRVPYTRQLSGNSLNCLKVAWCIVPLKIQSLGTPTHTRPHTHTHLFRRPILWDSYLLQSKKTVKK